MCDVGQSVAKFKAFPLIPSRGAGKSVSVSDWADDSIGVAAREQGSSNEEAAPGPRAAFNYARVACNEANCFLLSIKVKFSHLAASASPSFRANQKRSDSPLPIPSISPIPDPILLASAVMSVVNAVCTASNFTQAILSRCCEGERALPAHTSASAPEQLLLPQHRYSSSFAQNSAKTDTECVSSH